MQRYLFGLAVLISVVIAAPAQGGMYTGNDIVGVCRDTMPGESKEHRVKYGICLGYLAGILDAHETLFNWKIIQKPSFCFGRYVTREQLRQGFF